MKTLPKTMTVEALKRVQRKLVLLLSFMTFRGGDSNLELILADVDSWIAGLSSMEEPTYGSVVLITASYFGVPQAFQRLMNDWVPANTGFGPRSWQEILAIDPNPKVIYTPKDGE
jgi:hypothetical protein